MKLFPSAHEPAALSDGQGVLFWYGAPHVARAENSRRYRIDNRLEHLPGARSYVGRTLTPSALAGIRLVLVIRAFVDRHARRQIDALRKSGIEVWADYDDLLFECPLDEFPGAGRFWARLRARRRLPVYRAGLDAFDGFTCTTEPIAVALRALRPDAPVHVVPNVPSAAWIRQGWARYGARAWKPGDPLTLRYLPGSPSHDEDFASIQPALARLLHDEPRLELEIVGYLHFDSHHFPRGRVRHFSRVDYDQLPGVILPTWLNLVPLAPSRYSQARSDIKRLEAEAFDVPSVGGDAAECTRSILDALARGR